MSKSIRIKMWDNSGRVCMWTVRREANAVQLRSGHKPHKMQGWSFTDHEGYERFSEGNWLALVGMVRSYAANYGLSTLIS